MRDIIGYTLTVKRGARAGMTREYLPTNAGGLDMARRSAHRFADKLDNEYGAICASVQPIWAFATTPAAIHREHVADMAACGVAI